MQPTTFRPATLRDCHTIAKLYQIASPLLSSIKLPQMESLTTFGAHLPMTIRACSLWKLEPSATLTKPMSLVILTASWLNAMAPPWA